MTLYVSGTGVRFSDERRKIGEREREKDKERERERVKEREKKRKRERICQQGEQARLSLRNDAVGHPDLHQI